MNKKQLLSIAVAALMGASQSFAAVEYWVATNGSDENPGTEAKPFATPEMAVLMVKDNEETIIHLEKDATFMMAGQLNLDKNKICTIEGDNTTLKGAEKPGFQGGEASPHLPCRRQLQSDSARPQLRQWPSGRVCARRSHLLRR